MMKLSSILFLLVALAAPSSAFQPSRHPSLAESTKLLRSSTQQNNYESAQLPDRTTTSSASAVTATGLLMLALLTGPLVSPEPAVAAVGTPLSSPMSTSTTSTTTTTIAAVASATANGGSSILNHDYADPFHPYCRRNIQVNPDGVTFQYTGTAVGPKDDPVLRGCSPQEQKLYTSRKGAFTGAVTYSEDSGLYGISAGDGIHEGIWEPSGSASSSSSLPYTDVDGIRWNDGNKWIVQSQATVVKNEKYDKNANKNDNDDDSSYVTPYKVISKPLSTKIGEGIFYAYIGVSTLAGVKGVVDAVNRKRDEQQSMA